MTQPNPNTSQWKPWHKRVMIGIGALAVLLAVVVIAGLATDSKDDEPVAKDAPSSSPSAPVASTSPSKGVVGKTSCTRPDQATVDEIEGSLKANGQTIVFPNALKRPDGVTYLSANIMEGDKRISPMVVWAKRDGALFAVSSSAQRHSTLVDGRKLLDVNAGDKYGADVQRCVLLETTGRGHTGGN